MGASPGWDRLLCITPGLGAGGAERQAAILLPAMRRRGIDARALALDSGGTFLARLRDAGVPVEVLHMRHQLDLGPLLRSRIVRQFAPEVILSRGVSGLYVGHALARWRGAAHVYNDHRPLGVEVSRRRAAMTRMLARRLSAVIAVSEDQRERWRAYGCAHERIVVIPNGVEAAAPLGARAQVRRELGIADAATVALLVSSLRAQKRVPDFVQAVLIARTRCPELIGVVVGDGRERQAVEALAAGQESIRVLGERDDVPRLLEAADMLVNSSGQEAMPMAILEAMAAGLPVVATHVGAVPEVVLHGETGLLVAPGDPQALADAIVALAGDRERREAMGRAARERVRARWDAEAMTSSYIEVLSWACARRQHR